MLRSMFYVLLVSLVSVGAMSNVLDQNFDRECSQLFGGKSNCQIYAVVFQCGGFDPKNQEWCPGNPLFVAGGDQGFSLSFANQMQCRTPIGDEPCGGSWTNLVTRCNGVMEWWDGTAWVVINP